MDTIEVHQYIHPPAIADLDIAESTIEQHKEARHIVEMLRLTVGHD